MEFAASVKTDVSRNLMHVHEFFVVMWFECRCTGPVRRCRPSMCVRRRVRRGLGKLAMTLSLCGKVELHDLEKCAECTCENEHVCGMMMDQYTHAFPIRPKSQCYTIKSFLPIRKRE